MLGADSTREELFNYVSAESPIPKNFPLRPIRVLISEALTQIDGRLEGLYSKSAHPSIVPERLIRAFLLKVTNKTRRERTMVEQFVDHPLLRWFMGPSVDESVCDYSNFSKNRDQLFRADITRDLLNSASVDGTMTQSWASNRSYRPKGRSDYEPVGGGFDEPYDTHGKTRGNNTHASTTDPQAMLYRKRFSAQRTESVTSAMHRAKKLHGLVVEVKVSERNGDSRGIEPGQDD